MSLLTFPLGLYAPAPVNAGSPSTSQIAPVAYPAEISCEGSYQHHLQGVCVYDENVYWSFTTSIVKTNLHGKVLQVVQADNHQGDLCYHDGKLFVAVNLGPFNSPKGDAKSWVYVFSADDLSLETKFPLPDVIYGAGGIAATEGKFFVVGGLPANLQENFIYEYDLEFKLQKKHALPSGHTHLGIQTIEFSDNKWWFGCYGTPSVLLVATRDFQQVDRYNFDAALGIASIGQKRFYVAEGPRENGRHKAILRIAVPSPAVGLEKQRTEKP